MPGTSSVGRREHACAHSFRAGGTGYVYLAYGTRELNDIAYYPRSGKV